MKRIGSILAALSVATMISACSEQPGQPEGDDLAGESALDGDLGKADHASSSFTYYKVELDARRCVFPLCGGKWISRVNRSLTRCVDGQWAARCYVAEFDLGATGLSEAQIDDVRGAEQTLFRGTVEPREFEGFGNVGAFAATEAWRGLPNATDEGLFTRVKDNGIRCITTPCPSLGEAKLNSWLATDLEEVDFSLSGATDDEISKAYDAINGEDGVLVAGYRYWWWENNSWNKGRAATQFYTKVIAEATTGACFVGGCSSQVCSDQEGAISTCEWRAEYACYRTATCERQSDGNCGWTATEDLNACLANPPQL